MFLDIVAFLLVSVICGTNAVYPYGGTYGTYGGLGAYGSLNGGYGGLGPGGKAVSYASIGLGHAVPIYKVPVAPVAPLAKVAVADVPIYGKYGVYPQFGYGYESGKDYYAYPKYKYGYGVHDPHTGDYKNQQEIRDGDVVKGSYQVADPDGTLRTVHYTADDLNGFNAVVRKEGHAVHPVPVYTKAYLTPKAYVAEPIYNKYY